MPSHNKQALASVSYFARCDGDVYTIFNARVLSNPRQMCFLTYRITSGTVVIERQPGEILLQIAYPLLAPVRYQARLPKAWVTYESVKVGGMLVFELFKATRLVRE